MSLTVKAQIREIGYSSFTTREKTGIYHAVNNTTGFGAPNVTIAQVLSATAAVILPDTYTYLPTGLAVTIDMFPTLPNVIGDKFTITAADLGYTDSKLPDGIYDILISYGGSWGVNYYQYRVKQVFFGQVMCCIEALRAEVKAGDCGCNDEERARKAKDLQMAELYLKGLKADINCFKPNRAVELLKELKLICSRNPCNC